MSIGLKSEPGAWQDRYDWDHVTIAKDRYWGTKTLPRTESFERIYYVSMPEPLPEGWTAHWDQVNYAYYYWETAQDDPNYDGQWLRPQAREVAEEETEETKETEETPEEPEEAREAVPDDSGLPHTRLRQHPPRQPLRRQHRKPKLFPGRQFT